MKRNIAIVPSPSKELIDILPDYTTIGDVDKYKHLDVDRIKALRDKGFDGYINKTFKQQQNGFQSDLSQTRHKLV